MRLLIVGATSAIATETARAWAETGADFFLTGRDRTRLDAIRDDLLVRGAGQVHTALLDAADRSRFGAVVDQAVAALGGLDAALLAHGALPDQAAVERDPLTAMESFDVNATSTIGLALFLASYFERERRGLIAVIGSVAGDRGRAGNYIYGAAKGALERITEGLRQRLRPAGVAVLLIKPGFVATPMTAHLRQGPLFASSRRVGRAICRAMQRRRRVVYLPWFWRPIMTVIRALPGRVFDRLRF